MDLCIGPKYKGFGCNKCMYCRVKLAVRKSNRIMLESLLHEKTSFVTLTYSDEHLPKDCSLNPNDLRYFFMRLRSGRPSLRIRYFAVGEYGGRHFGSKDADRYINPHYHLALYGLDYTDADYIREKWGLGHTDVKFLEPASANYIAKYVTKKMTGNTDERLKIIDGVTLHPEFARQSLKPGIGAGVMEKLAKAYENPHLLANIDITGDIPKFIDIGNKRITLDRYLKRKLREYLGFQNTGAQNGWAMEKSLQDLQNFKEIEAKAEEMEVNPYQYKKDILNMKRSIINEKLKKKEIKL